MNEQHFADKQYHVLVVDDEELNVRFLSTYLSRKGYTVSTAQTGQQALNQIKEKMPDVVLLDVMMPEMDGFEVCRRLREDPATHMLPVIMVTALSSVEDEVRALDSGADDFLPKPINNLELLARLRSLLRIKSLHDQLKDSKNELEAKNKKLVELQGLRDSLTQMIVHDLKNPLTGIMGCSELLMMTKENLSEKQIAIVKKIDESATTILNMISDMLDISRMEENKLILHKQFFNITEILQANVEEFRIMMQKNSITAEIDSNGSLPLVEADKDMINRVIANLLHNAVKHSHPEGRIILTARHDPVSNKIMISIQDFGEGIPEEYHEKIFEKFSQADLKKYGLKTDRGLGLAFCKLAIEAHGGQIHVESRLHQGSKFIFDIPA